MRITIILFALFGACLAGWGANLAWFAAGQLSGGLTAVASNCPNQNKVACGIGALQIVLGAIGVAAGSAKEFGLWKRDEGGIPVLHLFEDSHAQVKYARHLVLSVKRAPRDSFDILYHHNDGTTRSGSYHFDAARNLHILHGNFLNNDERSRKREVVGGNDGFGLAFNDEDQATWANVNHAQGDTNEWAQEAYSNMGDNNDAICVGFTDPDNNEHVALARIQPATDGDYQALDLGACGNSYKRRNNIARGAQESAASPNLPAVECPLTCVQSGDNVAKCEQEGGDCAAADDGLTCEFSLNRAAAADCDGVKCIAHRGPC